MFITDTHSNKYFLLACVFVLHGYYILALPNVTLDEFFTNTEFLSLTLSPNDDPWILLQTKHSVWDENRNEYHLHLHTLDGKEKILVTRQTTRWSKPFWRGDWIVYMVNYYSDHEQQQYSLQLYSTKTRQITTLVSRQEPIHTFTWSNIDTSIYFVTQTPWTNEFQIAYRNQWKDVFRYRENERGDTIYRVDFTNLSNIQIEPVKSVQTRIVELICSPDGTRLVFSTESLTAQIEFMKDYEIYLINLNDSSPSNPIRLTTNQAIERNLKWLQNDSILFTVLGEGSVEGEYHDTQGRLYSLNLSESHIERWANDFFGSITNYALVEDGRQGVVILGQLKTNIHIYTQQSPKHLLVQRTKRNGSYEKLATNFVNNTSRIAFIYSSFTTPQEVYVSSNIDNVEIAEKLTRENEIFTQRNLPLGTSYQWLNREDGTEVEGTLLYPPDKFQDKDLPLFVLIHGGPYTARLNAFRADWYACGMMIATEGWLVLQPNYRGSTGYGDQFLHDVRKEFLSRPGKDILYGVDALILDRTANPKQLAIGGYSYGGYLTNWLITQTTRFNAAVSGAGAAENIIDWGTNDMPISNIYFLDGFPWEVSRRYQEEAALFQLNKVKTPTFIVVGERDIRVPVAQSYLFERALNYLDIPHQLIILPNEGHGITENPWHEKIKLREELKWLQKYGHTCVSICDGPLFSLACSHQMNLFSSLMLFIPFWLMQSIDCKRCL